MSITVAGGLLVLLTQPLNVVQVTGMARSAHGTGSRVFITDKEYLMIQRPIDELRRYIECLCDKHLNCDSVKLIKLELIKL